MFIKPCTVFIRACQNGQSLSWTRETQFTSSQSTFWSFKYYSAVWGKVNGKVHGKVHPRTTQQYRICRTQIILSYYSLPFHSIHFIYGATASFGTWPSSEDASIFLYLLLVSSILVFLGSAMCHSGRCPPTLFLVFPFYTSIRAKYCMTRWDKNCIRVTDYFLRQLSVTICIKNLKIFHRIDMKMYKLDCAKYDLYLQCVGHPHPSSAEVKETDDLCLYSLRGLFSGDLYLYLILLFCFFWLSILSFLSFNFLTSFLVKIISILFLSFLFFLLRPFHLKMFTSLIT
jgi:hypothetical protein